MSRHRFKQGTVERSQSQKEWNQSLKFFKSKRGAQSFLGSCYFRDFVPKYSELTAPLHDMVKSQFNWSRDTTVVTRYLLEELMTILTINY